MKHITPEYLRSSGLQDEHLVLGVLREAVRNDVPGRPAADNDKVELDVQRVEVCHIFEDGDAGAEGGGKSENESGEEPQHGGRG